jgi:hypothetical protein
MQHISFLTKTKISRRPLVVAAICALSVLATASARADDGQGTYKTPAIVRQNANLVQQDVVLTDLISTTAFDGKYFTVINGEGSTPVAFTDDKDLVLRAATAYNAFTQSRLYFLQTLAAIIPTLPQAQQNYLDQHMVIRLNMTHLFSQAVHFNVTASLDNAAVTIPASDEFKADNIPAWGVETWFFVPHRDKIANPAAQISTVLSNPDFKLSMVESLLQNDAIQSVSSYQAGTFGWPVLAENMAVSIGLGEGLSPIMAKAVSIIPGHVYLDTVMIPEIDANEYSHYALAPWLGLKVRFPVGEGYAHYFASKITGLIKLQDKGGQYSKGYQPIAGNSKVVYGLANEVGSNAASSSFTFALLEDMEKALGTNGLPVIIGTVTLLNDSSNLRIDLSQALMATIWQLDKGPSSQATSDMLQAQKVLTLRGM